MRRSLLSTGNPCSQACPIDEFVNSTPCEAEFVNATILAPNGNPCLQACLLDEFVNSTPCEAESVNATILALNGKSLLASWSH